MDIRTLSKGALCCLGLLLAGPGVAQTFFTEVTQEAGIFPVRGSRAALLGDYDHDGWPDLFRPLDFRAPYITLYHNEGNGHFTDHTAKVIQGELTTKVRGGGSVFGDYDNDGDLDLFVPIGAYLADQAGYNILLRNERGIFRDVALEAGLTDALPTDNALWFDYDRDGYLDLYIGNPGCGTFAQPVFNLLYRNRRDGTFEDATEGAGLMLQLGSTDPGGCGGGSNGGMVAGDFNDAGWSDLYIAVFRSPNRLFFNEQGRFRDATTKEIADPGEAFGTAVGDIDNDGDLDIFQTGGGNDDLKLPYRSPLLLNIGQGQFLDVTEGVGLGGLVGQNLLSATLGDIDNDGDLDLLTGFPHFLYLNYGDGTFVDQTSQSGITTGSVVAPFGFGDYDLDGFLDAWDGLRLYHNNGNGNHYLRVELVGIKSNRSGIGARLLATAGDLKQMREILGGYGYNQDELVAHFGLGARTQVDRLEVRWPSGQVDTLTDIPADQKIRIIEGRAGYQIVRPTAWETSDSLVAGTAGTFEIAVRPALFEEGSQIAQITADLSDLGGSAAVPLADAGEGTYRLSTSFEAAQNGLKTVAVFIDQSTSLGSYWTRLSRQVVVVPTADLVVFDEALSPDWAAEGNNRIKRLDLGETGVVHRGTLAGAFEGESVFSPWSVSFKPPAPISSVGYPALHFAFRPGAVTLRDPTRFTAALVPSKAVSLLDSGRVDLNRKDWQVVEIPTATFEGTGPIESISFSGTFSGTFYLDDIRLVAARPSSTPVTLVEEEHIASLPTAFSLSQNFPNPFNSETVIRFALPESEEVELAVYNLAGQQVAALVQGVREAGSYTVRWDGRDEQERELASGIYLYRLRAGERMETRKLVLLR